MHLMPFCKAVVSCSFLCCFLTRLVLMCSWQWTAFVRCTRSRHRSALRRCRTIHTLWSCCVRRSTVVLSRSTDTGWSAARTRIARLSLRATLNATSSCRHRGDHPIAVFILSCISTHSPPVSCSTNHVPVIARLLRHLTNSLLIC